MNPFRSFYVKLIIGLLGVVLAIVVAGDVVFYFLTGGERLFLFEEENETTEEAGEEELLLAVAQEPTAPDNAHKSRTVSEEGSADLAAAAEQLEAAAVEDSEKAETGLVEEVPASEQEKLTEGEEPKKTVEEEPEGLVEAGNTPETFAISEEQILKPAGLAWNMRTESGDPVGEGLAELIYAEEHEVIYPLMPLPPEDGLPDYFIRINRAQNCATVYVRDEAGEYTIPYKVLLCSTGRNNRTPLGTFPLKERYRWRCMLGGVWSQYATRVYRGVLIHSVPYYTKNPGNLEVYQYNRLGEQASAGCIRMNVRDAKWVYDHCREGTLVEVYDDADDPGPLGKPEPIRIEEGAEHPGWDPTDPEYPVDEEEE